MFLQLLMESKYCVSHPCHPDRPLIVLANVRIAIGLSVQNIIVNIVIKL